MWWGIHDVTGWWMVFGGVWMVFFWGAIIALVVWGTRVLTGPGDRPAEEDPQEIARRRYALGEINKEQFEDVKAALSGGKG